jgi:hypothetical protein
MPGAEPERPTQPLIPLDAGWLFLLSGLVILAAAILIPAFDDLDQASWSRDRAVAIEDNRRDRLMRYGAYLDALDHGNESVILSLSASQLNMIPEGRQPISPTMDPAHQSAAVFPLLEPEPPALPEMPRLNDRSLLGRLATGERSRLWMIGGGAFCVLLGVLPAATRAGRRGRTAGA